MTLVLWALMAGAIAAGNLATYLAILGAKTAWWHVRMWYLAKKYPMPKEWPVDRPLS